MKEVRHEECRSIARFFSFSFFFFCRYSDFSTVSCKYSRSGSLGSCSPRSIRSLRNRSRASNHALRSSCWTLIFGSCAFLSSSSAASRLAWRASFWEKVQLRRKEGEDRKEQE